MKYYDVIPKKWRIKIEEMLNEMRKEREKFYREHKKIIERKM